MFDFSSYEKLPISFYTGPDVVAIARSLLGKYLFTNIDGNITAGKIVESEAYNGRNDKACHAFLKRTKRTEIMYQEGGSAYIYLCYGIHHLFNVVTNLEGMADAILIRALEPTEGIDAMKKRRNRTSLQTLSSGPGTLSQAMGIHFRDSGVDLTGDKIWIARRLGENPSLEIESDVRIGIDYAEEDAFLPWRFYIRGNPFVSVKKKKTPA